MPASNINLIPQEEKREQTKTQLIKMSTYVSVGIAVVVGLVSAFLYYQGYKLRQQIKAYDENIALLRSEIDKNSSVEISARNLEQTAKTLKGILDLKLHYSFLLEEVQRRIPKDEVYIDSFSLAPDNVINISGIGENYISVAKFVRNLSDSEYGGKQNPLKGLFTSVTLNSVNLESKLNKAEFAISVSFDTQFLKK